MVSNFRGMNKLPIITLITLFASCTKDVTIAISDPESKIVINSFFSPQDSLLVNISKSIPILAADTLNYVDNADVELFQGVSLIGKLTYTQKGFYTLSTALNPKGEYTITVSVPGMESVSSLDTIPTQIPILSFDTVSVNEKYLYGEITFQDPAGESNYYLLEVTSKYPVTNSDSITSKYVELIVIDNIVENGSSGDRCKRIFFSDNKIGGNEYNLSFLLEKEPLYHSLQNGSNTIYINFKTVSFAYYKYLTTYYQSQTRQMDVYSNIINGYGIFAGYHVSSDSLVIQN